MRSADFGLHQTQIKLLLQFSTLFNGVYSHLGLYVHDLDAWLLLN